MTARGGTPGRERRATGGRRAAAFGLRALRVTAALVLLSGAAYGQTITVMKARPGDSVEAVWNTDPAGTATVDRLGNASIPLRRLTAATPRMDALVFVDGCDGQWRVLVAQLGLAPAPPPAGCSRQEITGIFVIRPISTIVVNVGATTATLLLRQGRFDPTATQQATEGSLTGIVLSGGAGLGSMGSDAGSRMCGSVAGCVRDGTGLGYGAGAAYWFIPFAAAEVAVLKPSDLRVEGADFGHNFTGAIDASVLTIAGLVGAPAGRARVYGKAGVAYHRATITTAQTIEARSITIGEVDTLTMPGGTQTLQARTGGWGLVFGGGFEVWTTRTFGFYGEGGLIGLKGSDLGPGEAALDDRMLYALGGVRVRLGR